MKMLVQLVDGLGDIVRFLFPSGFGTRFLLAGLVLVLAVPKLPVDTLPTLATTVVMWYFATKAMNGGGKTAGRQARRKVR